MNMGNENVMTEERTWLAEWKPGLNKKIVGIIVAVSVLVAIFGIVKEEAAYRRRGFSAAEMEVESDKVSEMSAGTGSENTSILFNPGSESDMAYTGTVTERFENIPMVKLPMEEGTDFKQEESLVPALTYEGTLRMDYCVGSSVDLSGICIRKDGVEVPLSECEIGKIDTDTPGEKTLTITYGEEKISIPYRVVAYGVHLNGQGGLVENPEVPLWNYRAELESPVRLGKEFTGWYRDEMCTLPFTSAEMGETYLELYAGWKEYENFSCDEEGYVTGYTGKVTDVLALPAKEGCIGVRKGAFSNLRFPVVEVFLPANISRIEEGAFQELSKLFYIEVSKENPNYYSVDGIVYEKGSGNLVVCPPGRMP